MDVVAQTLHFRGGVFEAARRLNSISLGKSFLHLLT